MSEKIDGVAMSGGSKESLYASEPKYVRYGRDDEGAKYVIVTKAGKEFKVKSKASLKSQALRGVWVAQAWNLLVDGDIKEAGSAKTGGNTEAIDAIMSLDIPDAQKAELIAKLS